mgnify:CR=1 FL=1
MKLNPKQLAASAALLGVLACAAALPASAVGPVTTPLALTLPKVSFPWDKVTAESIETGSYDAAPLAGTAQQLSPVTTPANAASKNGVTYVSDNPNVVSVDSEGVAQAVGLGTANITATCGGVSCTYTITPQPDAKPVSRQESQRPIEDEGPSNKRPRHRGGRRRGGQGGGTPKTEA